MAKENKFDSKIPIPVGPLPPISVDILKRTKSVKYVRHPLETLYNERDNQGKTGAIRKNAVKRSNSFVNQIETKHVTLRQQGEDLDWNYKVFFDNDKKKDEECCKALTPVAKEALEPSRVKNIKRSLRRPHSRELQGISPAVNNEHKEEKHKRRLVFTDRLEEPTDFSFNSYASSVNQDYGPKLFDYLMKNEKILQVPRIAVDARACVLNWLVKVNGAGGNPAAVQAAAFFFDHWFTVAKAEIAKMQLLATACYWLALKIRGNHTSSRTLVRAACYAFTTKDLLEAERLILNGLNFPEQPIVAQDFISYMSWVCDASNFVEIETTATLLYMTFLVESRRACTYYPSVAAAASICNALYLLKKEELLLKLKNNDVYKAASKKESYFESLCTKQLRALVRISNPSYEYRALIENSLDRNLTEKILTIVNKY